MMIETKIKTDIFANILSVFDRKPQTDNLREKTKERTRPKGVFNPQRKPFESGFSSPESISRSLDAMIDLGAAFNTFEDDFEIVGAQHLPEEAKEYLRENSAAVLCTLHQRLLLKNVFFFSDLDFENYVFEVFERESILADGKAPTYENYFGAVSDISRKWFIKLLRGEINED